MSDEIYPTIGFNIKTKIIQHEQTKNWQWQLTWNIEGPDEVFDRQSPWFGSKKEATENLLLRFIPVLIEITEDVFQ